MRKPDFSEVWLETEKGNGNYVYEMTEHTNIILNTNMDINWILTLISIYTP